MTTFLSTTILLVRRDGRTCMAADGQVTNAATHTVFKTGAAKVKRADKGRVLVGFAGGGADALALFARFERKLEQYSGNFERAVIELAMDWRTDRVLRQLEAQMIVANKDRSFLVMGNGDLLEPDEDGLLAIGSGGELRDGRRARAAALHRPLGPAHRRGGDEDRSRALRLHQRSTHLRRARANMTTTTTTTTPPASLTTPTAAPRAAVAMENLTPRQIVHELDKHVVGQTAAKRAVAIALRNRWRRQQLEPALAEEIVPKNILMIGPTGVGKTEIARRLAKLVNAPFLKIEATKFTEVGYVGRDVESIIRDLMELGLQMVRAEMRETVREEAARRAEDRLLHLLVPATPARSTTPGFAPEAGAAPQDELKNTREKFRDLLRAGRLEDRMVEIEVDENPTQSFEMFTTQGVEEVGVNLKDLMPGIFGRRKQKQLPVREAREVLVQQEAEKLIDRHKLTEEARGRVEQAGIVFLDEMDKIAGRESGRGPDVSREGVQRDLLPIVEGTTVSTKHGMVQHRPHPVHRRRRLPRRPAFRHDPRAPGPLPDPRRARRSDRRGLRAHPHRARGLAHAPVSRAALDRRSHHRVHGGRGGGARPHRGRGQLAHREHRRAAPRHHHRARARRGVVRGAEHGGRPALDRRRLRPPRAAGDRRGPGPEPLRALML